MKTTTLLIENTELTAFKKACFELEIKIINEINFFEYSKNTSNIEIEFLTEASLFYLGQLTQHFNQSTFCEQ